MNAVSTMSLSFTGCIAMIKDNLGIAPHPANFLTLITTRGAHQVDATLQLLIATACKFDEHRSRPSRQQHRRHNSQQQTVLPLRKQCTATRVSLQSAQRRRSAGAAPSSPESAAGPTGTS